MVKFKKIAFIFPGQGAQAPGMGKDFAENFSAARYTFEEADEILGRNISNIIFSGPEQILTQTKNSQPGIYITSIAILRVILEMIEVQPKVCAGLSLGEYTALTASESLPFIKCLPLIHHRAQFMSDACESNPGTMAIIIGMENEAVEKLVKEVNLPHDLWVANFNCPGQVVISGTVKGIEAATIAAKEKGAKRILPLQVQGAFHSGLMKKAETRLAEYIHEAPIKKGSSEIVMNVPGDIVSDIHDIRENLIKQVTQPVRWEQGIRAMDRSEVDLYIEIGPGKTLSGMNKRIGVQGKTFNVETVEDLDIISKEIRS
ncbi:MAG: ACP S-malonyltransferase [Parachlamydiaceae bacterium]|nr:ACP S-malonyltransferase [Parachlamydiaceae bacterium]